MTPSYYEEVTGAEPEYNCILFQTDESFSKEEMEEAGEKIVARDEVLSVSYMHDIEKQLDDMLGSLNLVIVVPVSYTHLWRIFLKRQQSFAENRRRFPTG